MPRVNKYRPKEAPGFTMNYVIMPPCHFCKQGVGEKNMLKLKHRGRLTKIVAHKKCVEEVNARK